MATLLACKHVVYQPTNGDGAGSRSSGDVSVDIVRYTNNVRAQAGLSPLSTNPRLMEAARIQADQMATFGTMEHTIPDARYPTIQSRIEAVGYVFSNVAENIAYNSLNAKDAVVGWMTSAEHRENILDIRMTEMGASVALDARGEKYWVQVFGRSRR
ncbi:MAG: CAP domain-containing protein [Gemmatimonadaceae bacterium]